MAQGNHDNIIESLWDWSKGVQLSHIFALIVSIWWLQRVHHWRRRFILWPTTSTTHTSQRQIMGKMLNGSIGQPSMASTKTRNNYWRHAAENDDANVVSKLKLQYPQRTNLHDFCCPSKDTELQKRIPQSTQQERYRFLMAKKGNVTTASASLQAYLQWHIQHNSFEQQLTAAGGDDGTTTTKGQQQHQENYQSDKKEWICKNDQNAWILATKIAHKSRGCDKQPFTMLPQIINSYCYRHTSSSQQDPVGQGIRDKQGQRIITLLPGRMDERLADPYLYGLAVALYIDRALARDSTEIITLLIDVRGGVGWRNLHATKILPFIQHTCDMLLRLFSGRLARAIVYPVPPAFDWLWKIVQGLMDTETRNQIVTLAGPATIHAPTPIRELALYVDEDVVDILETERKATFT